MTSYSDKRKYKGTTETICKGSIKDNVITITRPSFKKKEWSIKITKDELQAALQKYANVNYCLHELVDIKRKIADKAFIESIPSLREKRQASYDRTSIYDTGLLNDSIERVVKNLYKEMI